MPRFGLRRRAGRLSGDTPEGLTYLAEQTGGFAVSNTNNLASGLGRITDDVREYYVIGYVPDDPSSVRPCGSVSVRGAWQCTIADA